MSPLMLSFLVACGKDEVVDTAPPPLVEDMYRPTLRGVGKSVPATITVVQP